MEYYSGKKNMVDIFRMEENTLLYTFRCYTFVHMPVIKENKVMHLNICIRDYNFCKVQINWECFVVYITGSLSEMNRIMEISWIVVWVISILSIFSFAILGLYLSENYCIKPQNYLTYKFSQIWSLSILVYVHLGEFNAMVLFPNT